MGKLIFIVICAYLVIVAVISIVSAITTLNLHTKRNCIGSDFRPDYSETDRIWCRRQW